MTCINQFLKNNQRSPKIVQKVKNINQVSSLHKKKKKQKACKTIFKSHKHVIYLELVMYSRCKFEKSSPLRKYIFQYFMCQNSISKGYKFRKSIHLNWKSQG